MNSSFIVEEAILRFVVNAAIDRRYA